MKKPKEEPINFKVGDYVWIKRDTLWCDGKYHHIGKIIKIDESKDFMHGPYVVRHFIEGRDAEISQTCYEDEIILMDKEAVMVEFI